MDIPVDAVGDKARASLTTSGVFFGFSIAILGALMSSDTIRGTLSSAVQSLHSWSMCLWTAAGVILPYLVIWAERSISGATTEHRSRIPRYIVLFGTSI